jgi:type II secretory pathway pseudopilin PulG
MMGSITVECRTPMRARPGTNEGTTGTSFCEGRLSLARRGTDRHREVRGLRRVRDGGCRDGRCRDGGFSVVEVIMTITLVAIAIIPLMDATITSIRASTVAREAAEVETVLANASDRVNRAPTLCNYDIYVEAAALSKGWPADHATATYQYYEPGASALASDPGSWQSGACPGNARTPRLIQLVTISVTSESGKVTRSVKVVKSDV